MNTLRRQRRMVVTLLLGVAVLVTLSQHSYSQFGIGLGDDDGFSVDIFQAGKTGMSLVEARRSFTLKHEHYLGRAVAANILSKYTVYKDPAANRYVTLLGQTIAAHSDMPQTFGGYLFILLDSDEVNAFAAPGGIIFITRGMLRACENEDQLAVVLAHEIAHVQGRHGIELIKDSRWKKFGANLGLLIVAGVDGGNLAPLVDVFGDMVKDIANEIMTKGYGKKLEKQADTDALTILMRVGYEPHESITLMQNMQERFVKGKKDFAKTHPKPKDRIKTIGKALKGEPEASEVPAVRVSRFDAAMSQARAQ